MLKSHSKDNLEFDEAAIEEQEETSLEESLLDAEYDSEEEGSGSKEKALYKAIKNGDKPKIEQLLQISPALLDKAIFNGLTSLAIAIDHNQAEIIILLLEWGVSLETGHNLYPDAEAYARFWGKPQLATLIQQHAQQSSEKHKPAMNEDLAYKSLGEHPSKSDGMEFSTVSADSSSSTNPKSDSNSLPTNTSPTKLETGTQVFMPMPTLGQGDCAFHATFGKWDAIRELYVCKEVVALRKTVGKTIRSAQKDTSFFKAIQEAVQQLLMSGKEGGKEIKNLRNTYQQYLQANETAIQVIWKRFEETLNKYPAALEYVQSGIQTLPLEEKARLTTLQRQFNRCLNLNEGELYGIILSVEELDTQFKAYQQETNKDFDLSQYLTPAILEDYAALMEKSGYWLLPGELAIVAEALGTTLVLYITDSKTGSRKPIETYYPQGKDSVTVYFNGTNHYERIVVKEELEHKGAKEVLTIHQPPSKNAPPAIIKAANKTEVEDNLTSKEDNNNNVKATSSLIQGNQGYLMLSKKSNEIGKESEAKSSKTHCHTVTAADWNLDSNYFHHNIEFFLEEENLTLDPFVGIRRLPSGSVNFNKANLLGRGAFGQVYQGEWNKHPVALKEINIEQVQLLFKLNNGIPAETALEWAKEALQWEVALLSTVNHPNLVQFYGLYFEEDKPYLVLEYCAGGDLRKALEKKPEWSKRLQWAIEITQGLAYLHHRGIVHRDLKAENILIDKHGRANLADLGVAQVDALLQPKEAKVVSEGIQNVSTAAPEALLKDIGIDTPESDVYALGIVFWQLVSQGIRPATPRYSDNSIDVKKLLEQMQTGEREVISEDCPAEFKELILSCWAFEPSKRPKVEEVLESLNQLLLSSHPEFYWMSLCQQTDVLVHPKRLDGLNYIPSLVTEHQVYEDLDALLVASF